jgi:hypothetical protein
MALRGEDVEAAYGDQYPDRPTKVDVAKLCEEIVPLAGD